MQSTKITSNKSMSCYRIIILQDSLSGICSGICFRQLFELLSVTFVYLSIMANLNFPLLCV